VVLPPAVLEELVVVVGFGAGVPEFSPHDAAANTQKAARPDW
jgi:hypothetical protein